MRLITTIDTLSALDSSCRPYLRLLVLRLLQRNSTVGDLYELSLSATARTQQLPVVTANVDDFERMEDVQVINWEGF